MKKTVTKETAKPEAIEEVKAPIPKPKQAENTNPNQVGEKKTTKRPRVPKATDLGKLAPREQKDFIAKNAVENINSLPEAAKKTSNNKDLNPSYGKVPE